VLFWYKAVLHLFQESFMKTRLLAFTVFLAVLSLKAAEPTGAITGSVTDPSGAAVAGAKVTATSLSTALSRSTSSAVDGGYILPLLPVGMYSVSVEAAGFKRVEQRGIEVRT